MPLALSNQDLTILLAAAFTAVVWLMARPKMKRRTTPSNSASERAASYAASPRAGDVRAMTDEMNRLLVDLQEAARRITAQIDNRYQKLEALMAEVDEKIRRLEALQRTSESPGSADHGALRAVTPPPSAMPAAVEDSQHREVYALADRGKNPREIAQQVGKQPGEIELILALRPRAAG